MQQTPFFFPKVAKLLKLTFPANKYSNFAFSDEFDFFDEEGVKKYWQKLPEYLIARCPICGAQYTAQIDTHSLARWFVTSPWGHEVFAYEYQSVGCKHFVGVSIYINLNGYFPTELDHFRFPKTDIPVVAPELFRDDMTSLAVMHSLPICRIEKNRFVARYSLYTITYYAERPKELTEIAIRELYDPSVLYHDDGYHPADLFRDWSPSYSKEQIRNLSHWIKAGKLYWLDLDQPDLPLKSGPIEAFPYTNIHGFGCSYVYQKRPQPRWWWQQRNWHRDGEIRNLDGWLLAKPDW